MSPTSIDDLAALLRAPRTGRLLVGLAGAPGAGKSTAAAAVVARVPASALVPMDGFHLPQAELVRLGRRERIGAPDTFDVDGFAALLQAVRADDRDVHAPGFDRTLEEPAQWVVPVPRPARVVVVEGNYLLHDRDGWERIGPLLDVTVAVTLPRAIRLERLIARHERFGKSANDARAWATGPDEANAALIEPGLARADYELRMA